MIKVNSKTPNCPVCGASWFSQKIPKEHRENYSPPYYFSRLIGVYSADADRTMYYICPDCKTKFKRQ